MALWLCVKTLQNAAVYGYRAEEVRRDNTTRGTDKERQGNIKEAWWL